MKAREERLEHSSCARLEEMSQTDIESCACFCPLVKLSLLHLDLGYGSDLELQSTEKLDLRETPPQRERRRVLVLLASVFASGMCS